MTDKKKVLIVDDSSTAREFVAHTLDAGGYEVIQAGNGQEALELIRKAVPDAMVLDLLMPEMDGFDVLENLQEEGISFPIIVLTADIQEQVREEVLELGATALLNKPQVREHLLDTIKEILA